MNHHGIYEAHNSAPQSNTDVSRHDITLRWAPVLLLAYFVGRLLYNALTISPFVPPDEVTHAGLCQIFSQTLLLPANAPSTHQFGLVTNIPWFYYWIMGKLLHLNLFGIPDLIFLRILDIPLALGTVWYTLRLTRLLTSDQLVHVLVIAIMTNLPMFSLLSASISYDNMVNLLAAMSIYYLLAFFRYRSAGLLAASLLCQLLGSLTKISFLPLMALLSLLLLIHEAKNIRALPTALKKLGGAAALLSALCLVALGLNIQLYAGNYLRYGSLSPGMSQVISEDAAMKNRISARESIFRRYTEGKLSYMDALMQASEIKEPGDRGDTFFLLINYEKLKQNPALWMSFGQYTQFWIENMTGSIIGIKGHQSLFKDRIYAIPIYILLLLSLFGFIIRWRPSGSTGWLPMYLLIIVCCYSAFLMYKVNYQAYLYYGAPGITLQGRYLFPILAPLSALAGTYQTALFTRSGTPRLVLALTTILLLIWYDFPYFITHATPEWYTWTQK